MKIDYFTSKKVDDNPSKVNYGSVFFIFSTSNCLYMSYKKRGLGTSCEKNNLADWCWSFDEILCFCLIQQVYINTLLFNETFFVLQIFLKCMLCSVPLPNKYYFRCSCFSIYISWISVVTNLRILQFLGQHTASNRIKKNKGIWQRVNLNQT